MTVDTSNLSLTLQGICWRFSKLQSSCHAHRSHRRSEKL